MIRSLAFAFVGVLIPLSHAFAEAISSSAIRYALSRIKQLRPYLDHGVLELDNNTAE